MRKFLFYLFIVLLTGLSCLFAPQHITGLPKEATSQHFYRFNRVMGIRLNPDSPELMSAAADPPSLLVPGVKRQSRPLYILAGNGAGQIMYLLSFPFQSQLQSYLERKLSGNYTAAQLENSLQFGCIYLGYVLINILILLACCWLLEKNIAQLTGGMRMPVLLRAGCLLLLFSNQVVKYFFWTPHFQLFNILTPLLAVFIFLHIERLSGTPLKRTLLALAAGAMLLVYGNFPILLPAILLGYGFNYYQRNGMQPRLFVNIAAMVCFYVLPFLAWVLILHTHHIPLYNYEMNEDRQFIWIADQVQAGLPAFFGMFFRHTRSFLLTFGGLLMPVASLLFILLYIWVRKPPRHFRLQDLSIHQRLSLAVPFLTTLFFFWLLGFYADRLTQSVAVFPVLLCGMLLNSYGTEKRFNFVLCTIIAGWQVVNILYNPTCFGPHFFY